MKRKNTELQIRDTRKTVLTVIKYVVLIIGALVMMFPFIWMLLTSLKTLPEAISIPPQWMPETPPVEELRILLESGPLRYVFPQHHLGRHSQRGGNLGVLHSGCLRLQHLLLSRP